MIVQDVLDLPFASHLTYVFIRDFDLDVICEGFLLADFPIAVVNSSVSCFLYDTFTDVFYIDLQEGK